MCDTRAPTSIYSVLDLSALIFIMIDCHPSSRQTLKCNIPLVIHHNLLHERSSATFLSPVNGYAYWLGFGVYHSGVQVHGVEYAYGAHEHAATGIFDGEPRRCPGFVFRKAILIGRTDMGPREVRALVEDMAAEYSGSAYNLISKNCNHFCDDACFRLTGKHIPKLVNRLATIGFLCKCVLPTRVAEVRKRGEYDEHGVLHADKWRPRSNSARFPPAITATPSSNISQPTVTISSLSEGRRRLRRSASLSYVVGESSSLAV